MDLKGPSILTIKAKVIRVDGTIEDLGILTQETINQDGNCTN